MSCLTCSINNKDGLGGNSKLVAKSTLTFAPPTRLSSSSTLRQSAGIYLSSNASLACSSKLFAKENMTLGPSRELIEGGIFSINGMLNSSMSEKPRLISNAKVKI
jgi:hypothetical protein